MEEIRNDHTEHVPRAMWLECGRGLNTVSNRLTWHILHLIEVSTWHNFMKPREARNGHVAHIHFKLQVASKLSTIPSAAMSIFPLLCVLSLSGITIAAQNVLYGYDVKVLSDPESTEAPRLMLLNDDGGMYTDYLAVSEITICIYVYLEEQVYKYDHTLVGYGSQEHYELNEVVLLYSVYYNHTSFAVLGENYDMVGGPQLYNWTLICASWSGPTGVVKYYLNGVEAGKAEGYPTDDKIGNNGVLVLGQDQDDFNDYYAPAEGVYGRLTQFNAWDKVLTSNEFEKVLNGTLFGNIVSWRDSTWGLAGNAILTLSDAPNAAVQRAQCSPYEATVATDLTICLWFSSKSLSKQSFTLFYYLNSYGSKEMALVIHQDSSTSVVVGTNSQNISLLATSQNMNHWCLVWSLHTLYVYNMGSLVVTLGEFPKEMKMSKNGDLYVHGENSINGAYVKSMEHHLWERALSAAEVTAKYKESITFKPQTTLKIKPHPGKP